MADGRVVIEAILDATNVRKNLGELGQSINNVSWKNISAGDEKAQHLAKAFSNAGTAFTAKFTVPILAGLGKMAKLSLEFDKAMSKVATIADTTEVPIEELRGAILKLSDDTGIAASDIADNVYNAISAGQKTGDAVQFVATSSKLATAGFAESGQALDILTTTLNAYKLESSEATRVSDVLLQTQNKGKTTVAELSASMGRAIPTASAFNVNLENLAATYATTTANGIATAESTTYINSMIKELGDTGSTVGKILKEKTGKSFADLMAEGMSLGEALNIVKKKGDETNLTMFDMFGSAEAAAAAASVAGDGAVKFTENLNAMNDAAGLTDTSFETMQDSSWTLAKGMNEIKNIAIKLGDTLMNALKPHIERISKALSEFAEWFDELDNGTKDMILSVALLVAAIGPLLKLTSGGITLIGKVGTAFKSLNTNLKGSGSGLSALTSNARGAGGALKSLSGGMAGLVAIAFAAVIAMWAQAVKDAQERAETFEKATDGLREAHSALNDEVLNTADAIDSVNAENATRSFDEFRDSVDELFDSQAQLADDLKDKWSDVNTDSALLDKSIETIKRLSAGYDEYGNKITLNAKDQAILTSAVKTYNDITGDTIEIVDLASGRINKSTDYLDKNAKAWAANAKAQAAQESLVEIQKKIIENEKLLKEAQDKDTEAKRKNKEALDSNIWGNQYLADELVATSEEVSKLEENQRTLTEEQDYYTDIIADATAATQEATTASGENAEAMESQGVAASELSEEMQAVVDELTEFAKNNDVFRTMLKNSGMSIEDLVKKMDEAGVSASDLQSSIESFASQTQRAFDEIELNSEMSLDKMITNLKKNNEITQQWGDDMAILYQKLGGKGMDSFLEEIKAKGPEYAAVVHEMANATPEHMQELIDQWQAGANTAGKMALDELEAKGVDISRVSEEMAVEALAAAEQAIANDTSVQEAVDGIADKASMEKIPVEAGLEGLKVGPELASGIENQSDDVAAAADDMSKLAADHYSSATTDAWWAGHSMTVDNFLAAIKESNGDVVGECDQLSKQVADHLSSATVDAWWAGNSMAARSYTEGINSGQDSASYAARSLSKLIADHMSAYVNDAWWAGRNMSQGMENGIWAGEWGVVNAIKSVVRKAITAAKREADIRSPSHKFEWQGEMWDEGIISGVDKRANDVEQASRSMVKGAIEASTEEQATLTSAMVDLFANAMRSARASSFGSLTSFPGSPMYAADAAKMQISWDIGGGILQNPSLALSSSGTPIQSTNYDNSYRSGDIVVNMTIEKFVNETDTDGEKLAGIIARKIAAKTTTTMRGRGRV